jgi:cytochrome c peroxidase
VGAKVTASDGRGGSITDFFQFVIAPNSPPVVANANAMQVLPVGAAVDVDATQAGATFRDPDGDPLNYTVALLSPPNGLSIAGTRISGVLQSAALVRVSIVATDGISGSAENAFSIAGRGPEAGRPNLPAASYVYEDGLLALPFRYRTNTSSAGSFWDTTPRSNPTTNAGATLGRVLFYDKRLSVTNTMSCSSCHEQSHGFASSQRFNVGVQGVPLKRQAMPLANVRYNLRDAYFSDLRAQTLENLVLMPIQESTELGNSLDLLEAKLAATDFYPPLFTAAFGTPEVTRDRIAKAVAQFLRSMISYQSRFEQAFDTMEVNQPINPSAILTAQELAGQQVWATSTNVCGGCHTDFVFTTNDAQNNGLDATITDPGYQFGKFRAASLINIAVSGPYMHDGRFSTLREVIDHYDHGIQFSFNLPGELRNAAFNGSRQLNLSETDKQALEAFLNTLTDDKFLHDPKFSNPFP